MKYGFTKSGSAIHVVDQLTDRKSICGQPLVGKKSNPQGADLTTCKKCRYNAEHTHCFGLPTVTYAGGLTLSECLARKDRFDEDAR